MAKDWQAEFNEINKNLNKLDKRHQIVKQIAKDPAAYFSQGKANPTRPQV